MSIRILSIMLIILGIVYITLAAMLYKSACDKTVWWWGIVGGALAIFIGIGSLIMDIQEKTRYGGIRLGALVVAALALEVSGLYLLSTPAGAQCRASGSNLWLGNMIVHNIALPILTVGGLYYFVANGSK